MAWVMHERHPLGELFDAADRPIGEQIAIARRILGNDWLRLRHPLVREWCERNARAVVDHAQTWRF